MKRVIVRLSALSAVVALGALAIVQAQRSTRTTAMNSGAEPGRLIVDEARLQPMPRPDDAGADQARYTQLETQPPQAGRDPFAAAQLAGQSPDAPGVDAGMPRALPDSQAIPPANEVMGRYEASRPTTAAYADSNVQALGYSEEADPRSAPMPEPEVEPAAAGDIAQAPRAIRSEPTLAPPRGTDRYGQPIEAAAPGAMELPQEEPAALTPVGDAQPNLIPAPRGTPRAALRSAEPDGQVREAAQIEPQVEPNAVQPTDAAGDFAPPARGRDVAGAAGGGRPGSKQLEGVQTPALTLEKQAPAEIQVGKPAVFVLKIRNTGPVPAVQVEVHDQIPKGTQLISTSPRAAQPTPGEVVWTLGVLKPGEETSLELELMPTSEGEVGSVATIRFTAESSVRTTVTKPVLKLDVQAPKQVMLGEDLNMMIKLTNVGSGPATGVMLHEIVPEMLQHAAGAELEREIGTLKPNETCELDLSMKAVKPGHVRNTLTAHGEGNLRVDQHVDLEIVAADLQIKLDGPARRFLDRQATYTVSVTNPGTAPAKDVAIVAQLPSGLKFVEANNAGEYDPQTRSVHWLLEELPPSETGSVTLTAVPIEIGEQLVRVESTAERGLSAQQEKTITVEGVSAIFFEVVDVADPIEVGEESAYEIRVVNQGTKAATNVRVVALLPEELKATGAEGPARHTIDGQRVLFDGLAQLAPKADTTYRIKVQGLSAGDVRVRVQVMTDDIKAPVTKEESTRVYADEK